VRPSAPDPARAPRRLALVRDCPACGAPATDRVELGCAGGAVLAGCAGCRAEVAARTLRTWAPQLLRW
jgi:hypothetical protein